MTIEARSVESNVREIKKLSQAGAVHLRESGLELARQMELSGFLTVFSVNGMEECSQAIGESATPTHVEIAKAKIKTVLATHRSSSVQRARMQNMGQTREDLGNQIGSLLGGGVAIFADEKLTEFVGAIAFSGGTQDQDEAIARQAAESSGFFTDIQPKTEVVN